MDSNYNYQKVRNACNLLKNRDLQPILREVLGDFDSLNYRLRLEGNSVLLLYENGQKIYLDMYDANIMFLKYVDSSLLERIEIDLADMRNGVSVWHTTLEVRSGGGLVRESLKHYLKCYNTGKFELLSLVENSNVYKNSNSMDVDCFFECTRDNLMKFFELVDNLFERAVLIDFKSSLKILQENGDIYVDVNGEDVSHLYCCLDGRNLVNRIYDLYYGVINERNSRDIYLIHLKKLNMDAFGLRQLKGIQTSENCLIGLSRVERPLSYYQYINQFFQERFGVACTDMNSRIGLLKCITKVDGTVYLEREQTYPMIMDSIVLEKEDSKRLKKSFSRIFSYKKKKSRDL